MIVIENDGATIVRTSYWDSEHAARGLFYLSWNAGAARLLIPDAMTDALLDMRAAECVIVSRGPWHEEGGRDALELLFEDGSASPYCTHLSAEQSDRLLPDTDQGGGFVVTLWTRNGRQAQLPGRYRVVAAIPCLDAWSEQ